GLFAPKAFALLLLLFNATAAPSQQRGLQLTASVIQQQSCAVSESVDALRLTLQLRYTNAGKEKLILYKGNRLFFQIYISRGMEGATAAAGKQELRTTHSRYFDEQPEKITAPNPGAVFTTLSPGASYEIRQIISLPVTREGEGRFNVSIGAGEHVVSVMASTWYESRKLAEELRGRWRTRGFLWTDPLASNAVAFTVGKERATVPCQ
ncbi:MAG TPA: hypothetical protein VGO69_06585, partial [Pyrinomonadaceae bacterium]|nr:hypothetical protein [Pyrinomonadaceae bacterium]